MDWWCVLFAVGVIVGFLCRNSIGCCFFSLLFKSIYLCIAMCIGSSNWMAAQYQRLYFNLFNCRSMELSSSFVFISKVSIPRNIVNMKSTMLCNCWRLVDEVPSNAMRNLSKLPFFTKQKKSMVKNIYVFICSSDETLCASASISSFFWKIEQTQNNTSQ